MSYWSRRANVFRGERVSREIDEELQSHMEEAMAQGRESSEVRRSFGSPLQLREASRDIRLLSGIAGSDACGSYRSGGDAARGIADDSLPCRLQQADGISVRVGEPGEGSGWNLDGPDDCLAA